MLPDDTAEGQYEQLDRIGSPHCGSACGVSHRSYVRVVRVRGLDCDQPLLLVRGCGAVQIGRCNLRRADRCVPCSERYLRAIRRVAWSGLDGRVPGRSFMVCVTCPTEKAHQRVDPTAGKLPDGRHNYVPRPGAGARPACPCPGHLPSMGMARWNALAGKCWNRLRTTLSRRYGDFAFIRFPEVQKRGALHFHILVRVQGALDPHVVQDAALAAGFGCAVDVQEVSGQRAVMYVSKYVSKSAAARAGCPWIAPRKVSAGPGWIDPHSGELHAHEGDSETCDAVAGGCLHGPDRMEIRVTTGPASYRNSTQSQDWGLTVAHIRAEIRRLAIERAARAAALDPPLPADPTVIENLELVGSSPP